MTMIGAFFPNISADKNQGQGEAGILKARAVLRGSLRTGVILGELILLIGAVVDGYQGYRERRLKSSIEDLSDVAKQPSKQQMEELVRKLIRERKGLLAEVQRQSGHMPDMPVMEE